MARKFGIPDTMPPPKTSIADVGNDTDVDKNTDDIDFFIEQRKRKIEIARLDHRFRKITHPYFLMLYMCIIGIVYAALWAVSVIYDLPKALAIANGIKSLLSYLSTAVFSFMLSRFYGRLA